MIQRTQEEFDRSLHLIAAVARVSDSAQREIGRVFAAEAALVTETMEYVHRTLQEAAAGGIPEEQLMALCQDFEAYCQGMRGITVTAATNVIDVVNYLPQAYHPRMLPNLLPDEC